MLAGRAILQATAIRATEISMSVIEGPADDALVEECIEEVSELVMSLDRYPPAAVAVAVGTCLEGLLGALLDERQCTPDEIRELLREIESGILERGPADG
jgi:hypothetical protein